MKENEDIKPIPEGVRSGAGDLSLPETIFTLLEKMKQSVANGADDAERLRLYSALNEKQERMSLGERCLEMLRHSIATENKQELSFAVNLIQDEVNRGSKFRIENRRVSEEDLDHILQGGIVQMDIGTGSHGERIFIGNNSVYMRSYETGSQWCRDNFKRLFNLDPNQEESVNF